MFRIKTNTFLILFSIFIPIIFLSFLSTVVLKSPLFSDDYMFWDYFNGNSCQRESLYAYSSSSGNCIAKSILPIEVNFFRPLTGFTHWIDFTFWPTNSVAMHLHQIILFLILCLAVFKVARIFSISSLGSSLSVVALISSGLTSWVLFWVAARTAIVATTLVLFFILYFEKYLKNKKKVDSVLASVFLIASIFAGEYFIISLFYVVFNIVSIGENKSRLNYIYLATLLLASCLLLVNYKHDLNAYIQPAQDPAGYLLNLLTQVKMHLPTLLFKFSNLNNMQSYLIVSLIFISTFVIYFKSKDLIIKKFIFIFLGSIFLLGLTLNSERATLGAVIFFNLAIFKVVDRFIHKFSAKSAVYIFLLCLFSYSLFNKITHINNINNYFDKIIVQSKEMPIKQYKYILFFNKNELTAHDMTLRYFFGLPNHLNFFVVNYINDQNKVEIKLLDKNKFTVEAEDSLFNQNNLFKKYDFLNSIFQNEFVRVKVLSLNNSTPNKIEIEMLKPLSEYQIIKYNFNTGYSEISLSQLGAESFL